MSLKIGKTISACEDDLAFASDAQCQTGDTRGCHPTADQGIETACCANTRRHQHQRQPGSGATKHASARYPFAVRHLHDCPFISALAIKYVGAYALVKPDGEEWERAMTDYVRAMRGAALGARLRRLSAAIDADAARVYAAEGIAFEQRWFGVINQLALNGQMSVSSLADALGISHPSVSEARQSLEKAGLIKSAQDPADSRRRVLTLSPAGAELICQLRSVWDVFDQIARQLDDEAGGIAQALDRLEQALARQSLYARVMDGIASSGGRAGEG
jgi:DNA-binding MarR family transcriptional regulator